MLKKLKGKTASRVAGSIPNQWIMAEGGSRHLTPQYWQPTVLVSVGCAPHCMFHCVLCSHCQSRSHCQSKQRLCRQSGLMLTLAAAVVMTCHATV